MDEKLMEKICMVLLVVAFLLVLSLQCGCAYSGKFDGVVKNPANEIVYTIEGNTDGSVGFSEEFASGFSFFGLNLEELIFTLASVAGVGIGGGVVVKKRRGRKDVKAKK